jgi:hypothetical protein
VDEDVFSHFRHLAITNILAEMKNQRAQALQAASAHTTAFKKYGLDGIRQYITQIKVNLALGKPDWDIAEELGLEWREYNDIKKEMYKWDTAQLYDRPAEQQYIDYVTRQEACLSDLNELIDELDAESTAAAAQAKLGAIRAKSEIYDKIVKTGQGMGILEKAPERQQVVGGVIVAHLSSDELRTAVVDQLTELGALVERYGDAPQPAGPGGYDQLPAGNGSEVVEVEPVEKPEMSGDGKPFFARDAAARARSAKSARNPDNIKRTKVTRSGQ